MTPRTLPLALAAFTTALLAGGAARATQGFPDEIHAHLALSYTPACTICHQTPAGGNGTATQPFAVSMKARGLVPNDNGSLDTALDALAAEKRDSDGDGVPDIDELKAGTDPNAAGGGEGGASAPAEVPEYGCAAAPMRARGTGAGWLAAAMIALFVMRRRVRG